MDDRSGGGLHRPSDLLLRYLKKAWPWFAIGLPTAILFYGYTLERQAPRVVGAVLIEPTFVPQQGGRITIRYRSENVSPCPTDVDVAISKDGAIVWRHRGLAARILNEWFSVVSIPPLSPGTYLYHTSFRAKCSEARVYSSEAPDVKFEVR